MPRDLLVFALSAPLLVYIAYRDIRYRSIPVWCFALSILIATAVNTWYALTYSLSTLQKVQLMLSLALAGIFTYLSIYYSRVIGFGDVLAVLTAVAIYPFTAEENPNLLLAITPATIITLTSIVALDICALRRCTKRFPFASAVATATLAYGILVLIKSIS
jgi:Flp pilus assembly protein protease CpaA